MLNWVGIGADVGWVTRREGPLVPVLMLARWRDQIREPVEKLKR